MKIAPTQQKYIEKEEANIVANSGLAEILSNLPVVNPVEPGNTGEIITQIGEIKANITSLNGVITDLSKLLFEQVNKGKQ